MEVEHILTFDTYAPYFEQAGLEVKEEGDWLVYGEPKLVSQWVLYYSLHPKLTREFLEAFLPFAKKNELVFRLIKNDQLCYMLHGGNLGFAEVGKFLTVYCKNDSEIWQVTKFFNGLDFRIGPAVPGALRVGPNLYTNYLTIKRKNGGIAAVYVLPKWRKFPVDDVNKEWPIRRRIWGKYYIPFKLLHPTPKGDVVLALSLKNWTFEPVVIKEGRHGVVEDQQFRDIRDRLKWQAEVIQDLAGKVPTAKYLDMFEQDGNTFLVMEYLEGKYLAEVVFEIGAKAEWRFLEPEKKVKILQLYLKCLRIVITIHEAGYIHRDLQDNNFRINGEDVFIIDMELVWSMKTRKPSPAFPRGTPGYASPEQMRHEVPNGTEDVYSMAALFVFVMVLVHPVEFFSGEKEHIIDVLKGMELPFDIIQMVVLSLYEKPRNRPKLYDIETAVERYKNEILILK